MIILIKVIRTYEGVYVVEARESNEAEIIPLVDSAYDFKGKTMRIVVLPIHCTISAEKALEYAKDYADKPFEKVVDFAEYSQLQMTLQGGLKRSQQYNRKRWKPAKVKSKDRHYHDLSTENDD